MRTSRRTIAGMILLALLTVVIVVMQRSGGDDIAEARADTAAPPVDDTDVTQDFEGATTVSTRNPATAWAAIAGELTRDSSDPACVQVVEDAANFATRERSAAGTPEDQEAYNDWVMAELAKLERSAASLRDPEVLLPSFLLSTHEDRTAPDASRRNNLLEFGTHAASSGSPVLAWHALRACAEARQSCPISHLEQDLLDLQRGNAEAWALVAAIRYQRGDVSGALAAMKGAANASTATWHGPETIVLVERTLATHTAIPYPDSADLAFGAGAAAPIPTSPGLNTMCRVESVASRAWAEACLAFGTLRLEHIETEMGKGQAYGITRQALTTLGETERAAEAQSAYERFSAERMAGGQEAMAAVLRLQAALVGIDRAKLHTYLGAARGFGETYGRREFLRQEVPGLMERAGLADREGARDCMAEIVLEARAVGDTRQAILEHRLRPGDELHITLRDNNRSVNLTRRIGPDGKIRLPRGLSLTAAGVTTEQFQRELATAISGGGQPPEALVIPISRRPRGELRQESGNASRQ